MTLLGLGEIFGGQIVGLIKDKVSNRSALLVQIVLTFGAFALVFLFN